jgi:hypothetical protein
VSIRSFRRRKARKAAAFGAAFALSIGLAAGPAIADNYTRTRSGSALWSPDIYNVGAQYWTGAQNLLTWQFGWSNFKHKWNLGGSHRAFELKAKVPPGYAQQYGNFDANNFPSGSRPYRDTMQFDFGSDLNFGFGAANTGLGSSMFADGVVYEAKVSALKTVIAPGNYNIEWSFFANSRLDHDIPCTFTDAFCSFNDYKNVLVRSNEFQANQNSNTWKNRINNNVDPNPGFEDGGFGSWKTGAGNYAVNCAVNSSVERSCHATFKNPNGDASIMQAWNKPLKNGDNISGEAAIQCSLPAGQNCDVTMEVMGYNDFAYPEVRLIRMILPGGGASTTSNWKQCTIDGQHGDGSNPMHADYAYSAFRIRTAPGTLVSVDWAVMRGYTTRINGTSGDPGAPANRGDCVPYDAYYSG